MTEIEEREGAKYAERSPVPRRQLASLPANQRSYSRMSSKGLVFGDDSPLRSPIPPYPRRRSVTFAMDTKGHYREERPEYHTTYSASAPVSPVRERAVSPAPMSILKQHSSYGEDDNKYYDNGREPHHAQQNESKTSDRKTIRNDYYGSDKNVNSYHTDNTSTAAGLTDNNNNNNNDDVATTRSVSGGNTSFSKRYAFTDSKLTTVTNSKIYSREAMEAGANKENELPTQSNMHSSSSSLLLQKNHSYHSPLLSSNNLNRSHNNTTHSPLPMRSSRHVSPVTGATRRGRSASRQRLAQRRREAELQHSFYDDSFVEEFVLSTKAELEREEELRRLEEQQRASVLAEAELKRQRAEEEKLSAVEKAKRILTSKVQRRSFSVTPPRTDTSTTLALQSQTPSHNHREQQQQLEQEEEEKHVHEKMINNNNKSSSMARYADNLEDEVNNSYENNKHDKGIAKHALESSEELNPRKRIRRHLSESARHLSRDNTRTDDTNANTTDRYNVHENENTNNGINTRLESSTTTNGHKRKKLEKIVNQLLQRQRQSQSKRSVVVIDWEDVDSSLASETFDNNDDENENDNASALNKTSTIHNHNKQTSVLRQTNTTQTAQHNERQVCAECHDTMGKRLDRIESERRHRSHSRNVLGENVTLSSNIHGARTMTTSHQRHHSIVPDLADDSALYDAINVNDEEDRPILLPRRRQRQLIPTRSLSQLAKRDNYHNDEEEEEEEEYNDRQYNNNKRRNKYSNSNANLDDVKFKNKKKTTKKNHVNTVYNRHDDDDDNVIDGERKNVIFETDEDKERIMRQAPKITHSAHRSHLPIKTHRDDVDSNKKNNSTNKSRLAKKGPVASDLFAPHRQGTNSQTQNNGRSRKNNGEQEEYFYEEEEYQRGQENGDAEIDNEEIGNSNRYNNINNLTSQGNNNISNRMEVEGDNLLFGTNNTIQRGKRAPRTTNRLNTAQSNNHNNVNTIDNNNDDDDDDPMAVFFNAAFPSPSKFDEMVMQAGGLPETRHTNRRQRGGHQPSLILPSSISRRR